MISCRLAKLAHNLLRDSNLRCRFFSTRFALRSDRIRHQDGTTNRHAACYGTYFASSLLKNRRWVYERSQIPSSVRCASSRADFIEQIEPVCVWKKDLREICKLDDADLIIQEDAMLTKSMDMDKRKRLVVNLLQSSSSKATGDFICRYAEFLGNANTVEVKEMSFRSLLCEPSPGLFRTYSTMRDPDAVVLAISDNPSDLSPRTLVVFNTENANSMSITALFYSTTLSDTRCPPIVLKLEFNGEKESILDSAKKEKADSMLAFYREAWTRPIDSTWLRVDVEKDVNYFLTQSLIRSLPVCFPSFAGDFETLDNNGPCQSRVITSALSELDVRLIPEELRTPALSMGYAMGEHLTARLVSACFPVVGATLVETASASNLDLSTLAHKGFTAYRAKVVLPNGESLPADDTILESLVKASFTGHVTFDALSFSSRIVENDSNSNNVSIEVTCIVHQPLEVVSEAKPQTCDSQPSMTVMSIPVLLIQHTFALKKNDIPQNEVSSESDVVPLQVLKTVKTVELTPIRAAFPQSQTGRSLLIAAAFEKEQACDGTEGDLQPLESEDLVKLYSSAVGDHNPIHTQPEMASIFSPLQHQLSKDFARDGQPSPQPVHGLLQNYRSSAVNVIRASLGSLATVPQKHQALFVRPTAFDSLLKFKMSPQIRSHAEHKSDSEVSQLQTIPITLKASSHNREFLVCRTASTRQVLTAEDMANLDQVFPRWHLFAGQGSSTARLKGFPLYRLPNLKPFWFPFCMLVQERLGFSLEMAVGESPPVIKVDLSSPAIRKRWEDLHRFMDLPLPDLKDDQAVLTGPGPQTEVINHVCTNQSPLKPDFEDMSDELEKGPGVLATSLIQQIAVASFEVLARVSVGFPAAQLRSTTASPFPFSASAPYYAGHSLGEVAAVFACLIGDPSASKAARDIRHVLRDAKVVDLIDVISARGFMMHYAVPRDNLDRSRSGMLVLFPQKHGVSPLCLKKNVESWDDDWADFYHYLCCRVRDAIARKLNVTHAFLELANLNSFGQQYVVAGSHLALSTFSTALSNILSKHTMNAETIEASISEAVDSTITKDILNLPIPENAFILPRSGRKGLIAMKFVDIPFHTSTLTSASVAFRKALIEIIAPVPSGLVQTLKLGSELTLPDGIGLPLCVMPLFGRWFPNILGDRVFEASEEFIGSLISQFKKVRTLRTKMPQLNEEFPIETHSMGTDADKLDMVLQDAESRLLHLKNEHSELAEELRPNWWLLRGGPMLLVELLSMQIVCPVLWHKTQGAISQPIHLTRHNEQLEMQTRHVVSFVTEWSPECTLLSLLKHIDAQTSDEDFESSTKPVILRRDGIAFASRGR